MTATATRLTGIGEYYFSQKLREISTLNSEGKDIINLGIGSPDQPPHPDVIATLQRESSRPGSHAYQGYRGVPALRNAFAAWYQKWYEVTLDPEKEILPLIGSKEGLMHVCMTYLNPGDQALIPNPGYPTYSSAVRLAGAEPLPYLLTSKNNWLPDFSMLDELVAGNPRIKIFFVNYPHMPTGQLPSRDLFEKLVAFGHRHRILICHDNPYSFILNKSPMSMLSIDEAKGTVLELNSLSKSHNMAGWRIGVLCGAGPQIDEVLRFKSNMDSGMFLPLQLAAARALELGEDWFTRINEVYATRRKFVIDLLRQIGCLPTEGQAGMFIWAAIPSDYADAYALSDKILYEAGVFLTPGGIFGTAGEQYLRVSLCSPEEKIQEAIIRIKTALS
ncbi:MAG TPA: aminotransferase class I/II-fold pyridoxal phosphate-dependent enzyme [Flavitalea sp.]|nr:aminotransferase class I/II-fold pyridoxal phosphate-dependent enzyme [Flavitalea sp.]